MWGQPSVRGQRSQYTGSRCTAELAPFPRRRLTPDIPGIRSLVLGMCVTLPLVGLWTPGTVNAQDLADSVFAINNELINDTRLTSGLLVAGPPEVAREISIVDSAMFDAANAASGSPYSPIAYSGGSVAGASVDLAALSAGYTALSGIFSNSIWAGVPYPAVNPTELVGGSAALQTTVLNAINATYSTALNNLETIETPSIGTITASLALGVAAGNANMVANGYTVSGGVVTPAYDTGPGGSFTQIAAGITNPYVPANTNPGTYIPPSTNPIAPAPGNRVAMFPTWGSVAPAGLTATQMSGIEANVPPPFPLTSAAYANNVLETECGGSGTVLPTAIQNACAAAGFSQETTAAATAALFWNDPGTTYQPPGHWLQITDGLATSQNLSTLQAARLGSLVGEALDDAGIGAWDIKYTYNLWRPITAIQNCSDWNPNFTTCDPDWTSLIATPPHPDYLAGHPAFSGAAATVLENFFDTDDIPVTSTSDAYCNGNGSSPLRSSATGPIVACVVSAGSSIYAYNGGATIYTSFTSPTVNGCVQIGGTISIDINNNPVSCTIGATTYAFNPNQNTESSGTGCNDIVNVGGSNDSALICPITETFATISDASSGPSGAEFSRVVGGIHTPDAVIQALALGNQVGQAISNENNLPEPGAIGLLVTSLGLLAGLRRYVPTRAKRANAPRARGPGLIDESAGTKA